MCGFVGAIARGGNSLNDGIQRFVEASRRHTNTCSRGPDFNHLTKHETLHLIHFRLKIMDLSDASNQPYENDRYILVYNGEIYNFKELAARFHYAEEFLGDTQFLFKFLATEGASAIHLLRGMFAFAFIDKQTGDVLLARDQFGQKPLYFTEKNSAVIFASRAEYLAELHSNQFSEDGLRQYKVLQSYVGPTTLYKNVFQVEPGTYLHFQPSGQTYKTRYWKPSFGNNQPSKGFLEDLKNLIEKSVERTLLSDVDVACTASGGLDSSLVAAIASKGVKNLQAYHGRFAEDASCDESFYALSQARFSKFNLKIIELNSTQFEGDLLATIRSLGMVSSGPGSVSQYRVAKSISENHKVYLSGQGGDEIFGGYARYFPKSTNPKLTKILLGYENLVHRASHHSDPLTSYLNVIRRSFGCEAYPNDTDHMNTLDEIKMLFDETDLDLSQISYERLGMFFDQIVTLPNLLSVEDSISMIHGIEGRYPLLDLDLVNFMNSLDVSYLFENGPKSLLSIAASKHICPEILARTDKMGFPLPLKSWGEEGKIPVFFSYLENNSQGAEHRDVWGQVSLAILKSLR
jgi:asparagine synthase (glutamine-hydrolysing)